MKCDTKNLLCLSVKDSWKSVAVILIACLVCLAFLQISESDYHVSLIFVLAVMFISRSTEGYFYGIASSLIAIFSVNYVFTYPYLAFNFTLAGYPLTFISMLAVSITICALTTRLKIQERERFENEKEKIRANLLRAISHDLRTPLTSIIGSVDAVCENIDSIAKQKQVELLSEASKDAQWLIRMVENLLSITRINDDVTDLKKEKEVVEEVISGAIGKIKKQYPEISISVSIPQDILLVPMDAILIEQVIINLLHNSISHGVHTTEIKICVTRSQNKAIFTIEDNGVGFSKEPQKPMKSNIPVDNKNHMGIGLSVCKSIIKAHGGRMEAEDSKDGGAKIKFIIPMEPGLSH